MEGHHHADSPEWQAELGSGLVVAGALLLLFDAVALMFVPSDMRGGTHFFEMVCAVIAVLAYRAISFWLPTVPGAIAYFQLRRTVARWRNQELMLSPSVARASAGPAAGALQGS